MQIGGYLKSGNYPEISQRKKQILKQRMPVKTGSSSCNKFVDVFLQPRLSGPVVKEGGGSRSIYFKYSPTNIRSAMKNAICPNGVAVESVSHLI